MAEQSLMLKIILVYLLKLFKYYLLLFLKQFIQNRDWKLLHKFLFTISHPPLLLLHQNCILAKILPQLLTPFGYYSHHG